jgi:hypothetical protein
MHISVFCMNVAALPSVIKKFFRDKFLNIERNKLHGHRKTNTEANDSLLKFVLCFLARKTDSIQEGQFYIFRYLFSSSEKYSYNIRVLFNTGHILFQCEHPSHQTSLEIRVLMLTIINPRDVEVKTIPLYTFISGYVTL